MIAPGLPQALDAGRIGGLWRWVVAAHQCRHARDMELVFDRKRHAVQGTAQLAGLRFCRQYLGLSAGAFGVDKGPRLHAAFQLLDARESGFEHLAGRELAVRDALRQLTHLEIGEGECRCHSSVVLLDQQGFRVWWYLGGANSNHVVRHRR